MRILVSLLLISISAPIRGFASTESRVISPDNLEIATVQKLEAGQFGADLGFRMAGVEIESVEKAGETYQVVKPLASEPELFGQTGEEGYPDLPVYAHMVGIPDRSGARVEIVSSSYEILDNYNVMPTQVPVEEGSTEEQPFVKDDEAYSKNQFYPSEVVALGSPVILRDLRMIQVIINPIQYNPVTRQLKVYTSIDYNVIFEGTDGRNVKVRRSNRIAESFMPLYRAAVPNADEMLAAYEPVKGGYLIITPDAFADTMAVLGRWKHLKGYDVVIATGSDIDPNGNTPTSIEVKDYIQNAYDTWENPPEYVCIVGDVDLAIPDYPYGSYTSDHKYSLMDGDDFLSDIMVTRMSVPYSFTVLSIAMNKVLTYEKNPNMNDPDYWNRGLSVAGNVYAVTPRLTVLWARYQLMSNGFYQVDTSFSWAGIPGHPDYNPGAGEILASMNNGVSIVSYRGWAGPSGWYNPSFSTSNLDQVQNTNKIGVMASIVCGTGAFGYGECFGEKWIRMGASPTSFKGGPGFFGTTNTSTHTKWNNPIMIGYYWGLLHEGIHNFALAAFRGKLNQFNCFPNHDGPGGRIEQYNHQYNTLGEPEFDVRTTTPMTMAVSYPSSIPVGTNMMTINVTGDGGSPLEKAYVNLVKGYGDNEEVFVGGRTDQDGNVTLDFSTSVADTMFVTVTAVNYIPHLGFALVQDQPVAVGVSAVVLDDDNVDNSSGNDDGNANPGETVEFAVTLRNFGNSTTATNVQATISSPAAEVQITVPTQSYGNIAPGNTANSGKFAAHFDSDIPQGEHFVLQLAISSDQGSWTAAVPVDVKSMLFLHMTTTYPGNGNGRIDPGESSSLVFELQNIGELAGTSISGLLATSDPLVIITDNSADFGDIDMGGTGSNDSSPFAVDVDYTAFNGRNVNFDLQLTSSNGSVTSMVVPVVIGSVSTFDPVGPDDYGYYMYDNTDIGYNQVPMYDWAEISPYAGGSGTRITFPHSYDDDASIISLPFDFVYYGDSYDYMLVCINGFVAFDTSTYDMGNNRWSDSHNMHIPELGAPYGLIGPFWDDLEYSGNNGVFRYYDAANNRFIIEWKNMVHAEMGTQRSFQMIIYDPSFYPTPTGDSEILFQYEVVNNDDNDSGENPGLYCTVGFQNYENTDGLQYTFDNIYHPGAALLTAGRAIKITTAAGVAPPPEIAYDPQALFANAGIGETTAETLNIANIGEGTLIFSLSEVSGDRRLRREGSGEMPTVGEATGYRVQPGSKDAGVREPYYPPVITDFGGPDAFGNRWIDSDEPGGPIFDWVDITGSGTEVAPGEDGYVGPVSLGFPFQFYENTYSSLYINSNGNLTFTAGSGVYTNGPIPDGGAPNNQIAIYWDDLSPQYGHVYYYQDTANNRFIVSYIDVPHWNTGGSLTFQAIMYPTGQINFQYGTLEPGNDNLYNNTIGIENSNGTDGLQIVYNAVYVHENMAIKIYTPVSWMYSDIHSGILSSGEDTSAVITFDAAELDEGTYTGSIEISCNDPSQSSISIPVTFVVGSTPPCEYVIGDFNGSQDFNVADVVAAFSKLKTGDPDPAYLCECPSGSGNEWAVAMDVNSSCSFNIADVVAAFSRLKVGTPELTPCELCPPGGRSPRGNDRPLNLPRLKSKAGVGGESRQM